MTFAKISITAISVALAVVASVAIARPNVSTHPEVVTDMDAVLLANGSEVSYYMWRGAH